MRSVSGTRRLLRWIGNGLLVVFLVWTLVPFYWMLATSLKKDKEIYGFEATLVPRQPTFDAYRRLFAQTPFVKYLVNSTIIAVSTTAASLVLGCLGAYALADGCSRMSALVRIILPMSLPALAVVAFFSFTQAWNEFLYANVFVNSVDVRTITTGLTLFVVEDVFFWGPMMGAACLATIPPVLIYLIFQRWVVKGLTLGAVKG